MTASEVVEHMGRDAATVRALSTGTGAALAKVAASDNDNSSGKQSLDAIVRCVPVWPWVFIVVVRGRTEVSALGVCSSAAIDS